MKAKELRKCLEEIDDDAEILISIEDNERECTWWDFDFDDGGNMNNALLHPTEEMMN